MSSNWAEYMRRPIKWEMKDWIKFTQSIPGPPRTIRKNIRHLFRDTIFLSNMQNAHNKFAT